MPPPHLLQPPLRHGSYNSALAVRDEAAGAPRRLYVPNPHSLAILTIPAVTPTTAKALLDAGYVVNVERSPVRIFQDEEFSAVGATLVPEGSWVDVSKDHLILGLKELPEEECEFNYRFVN